MAIKVFRTIIKDSGGSIVPMIVGIPFLILIAMIPVQVEEENPELMDNTTFMLFLALPFIIFLPVVPMFFRGNAVQIIKTANIEKRMERLKKLGADEFVKQTKAILLDQSERGNQLYSTENVVKGRTMKFLVYGDISTDRKYISFVRENFTDADEAMASKFSLSSSEYSMLKRENES